MLKTTASNALRQRLSHLNCETSERLASHTGANPSTMPSARKGKVPQRPAQQKKEERGIKRKRDQDIIAALQSRVDDLDIKATEFKKFTDLPLCEATASGLRQAHFQDLTDVQARAIPHALKGQDILGAAKTGSGKTLAFLVPVLEKLYRANWTEFDGLGALIISPTRELAAQIFDVLRKIGRNHPFSAGMVTGGKSMKEEADRLGRMNILVCTPGRMLQHLDQTAELDVNNLQILVLDEADRIMDMGFSHAVDALVEHLPKGRQTLLFSATQSKKVSDIARLSLNEPQYISVHEAAEASTPALLQQHWIEVPLPEKIDTLYGFIRANVKSKMIVFLSSTKQVRYVYEALKRLQPGIPLLHLIGRQKQEARLAVTKRFRAAKYSCLFATDVVARGIDFPAVDWVVQVDAPEDVDTYVHRVGRTARFQSAGHAVLFLDPSEEEGMMKKLEQKKVPIKKTNIREKKKKSISNQLQDLCFKNPDIKYLAQKAFISYVRSIQMQRDKETFQVEKLDLNAYASNMGLSGTPQIKFKKGDDIKMRKNAPRTEISSGSESSDSDDDAVSRKKVAKPEKPVGKTKYEKMAERKNQDVLSSHYRNLIEDDGDNSDQEFFAVKRVLQGDDLDGVARTAGGEGEEELAAKTVDLGGKQLVIDSKRREKLLKSKKKLASLRGAGSKLVFDDEGNAHELYELQDEEDFKRQGPAEEMREAFVEEHGKMARERDVEDKLVAKQKRREKRDKRRERERAEELGQATGREARLESGFEDGEDPLALLRSLPMGDEDASDSAREEEPPKKKPKKWFQDDSEDEAPKKKKAKKGAKVIEMDHEPETLEDYEALAQGLLEG